MIFIYREKFVFKVIWKYVIYVKHKECGLEIDKCLLFGVA